MSDPEIQLWALEIERSALYYRKFLRSEGRAVSDEEIERLEKDVKAHERLVGVAESEFDLLSEALAEELQFRLARADAEVSPSRSAIKAAVQRLGHLVIRMRPESNHDRPHFHLEYKREFSASYCVNTFELLAGRMPPNHERRAVQWATENRAALLNTWYRLQAGEDVRSIVVAEGFDPAQLEK